MRVVLFNTEPRSRNLYIVRALAKAIAAHPDVEDLVLPTYADVVRVCQERRPDLFLAVGGAGAFEAVLIRALASCRFTVLWTTEDPYELDRNIRLSRRFDYTFTNDVVAVPHYSPACSFLPLAASSLFHACDVRPDSELFFDLFFVGTAWPERVELLNRLVTLLPRTMRKKIGLSGNAHLPGFHLGDVDQITDFRLAPREFARFANRARVTLTLDRSFARGNTGGIEGTTPPPRLFETAAAGTAQVYLSERAGSGAFFDPESEIRVVDTIERAAEAIVALGEDRDLRARMAEAAHRAVMSKHTYEHRFAEILRTIAGLEPKPRPPRSASTRRILFVTHNVAGVPPFGGVEMYQENMVESLSDYEFYMLYPVRGENRLSLVRDGEVLQSWGAEGLGVGVLTDRLRESILGEVLHKYKIDLVHYHHLIGHPLSLPNYSYAAGVPSVFHVHDYYSVCVEFCLLGLDGRYCDIREDRTEVCDVCLSSRSVAPPEAQGRRRWVLGRMLERVDAIVHGAQYSVDKLTAVYPEVDCGKHAVIGNTGRRGVVRELVAIRSKHGDRFRAQRLAVTILGNFTREKGGQLLIAMFFQLADLPIDFRILGRVDADLKQTLEVIQFKNVEVVGEFDQRTLPPLLVGQHVSLHFSIWPETYCISLDEARAAGLVPVVLGRGALGERVRDGVDGFVIDPDHPYDLMKLLKRLAIGIPLLEAMIVDPATVERIHGDHFGRIRAIYERLIAEWPVTHDYLVSQGGQQLTSDDHPRRFDGPSWITGEVRFDDSMSTRSIPALRIEAAQKCSRVVEVNDIGAVAEVCTPAEETIRLVVDEVDVRMIDRRTIILPACAGGVCVSVRVPPGHDIVPIRLFLSGERNHRVSFVDFGGDGDVRADARLRAADLPAGSSRIVLDVMSNGATKRLASGAVVVFGGADPVAPKLTPTAAWSDSDLPLAVELRRGVHDAPMSRSRFEALIRGANALCVRDAVTYNLDRFGVEPYSESIEHVVDRALASSLSLAGWAFPKGGGGFQLVAFRIVGHAGGVSAVARRVERQDVARHFKDRSRLWSGFEVDLPLTRLEPGNHRLEFVAMDDAMKLHVKELCRFRIA